MPLKVQHPLHTLGLQLYQIGVHTRATKETRNRPLIKFSFFLQRSWLKISSSDDKVCQNSVGRSFVRSRHSYFIVFLMYNYYPSGSLHETCLATFEDPFISIRDIGLPTQVEGAFDNDVSQYHLPVVDVIKLFWRKSRFHVKLKTAIISHFKRNKLWGGRMISCVAVPTKKVYLVLLRSKRALQTLHSCCVITLNNKLICIMFVDEELVGS